MVSAPRLGLLWYDGGSADSGTTSHTGWYSKGPTTHNPLSNPEKAFNRRNHVLRRMFIENYIDEATYEEARNAPLTAAYYGSQISAPYLAEMVRTAMIKKFGTEEAYTEGIAYSPLWIVSYRKRAGSR